MKKMFYMLFGFMLIILLFGCSDDKEVSISEVIVDYSTLSESYSIDEFDIEDFELIVTLSDGSTSRVPITKDMISLSDLEKLSISGTQTIEILYEGYRVSLTIHLIGDSTLTTLLKSIYQTGVTAGSIEDLTYDEWLETIRGEQGPPGNDGLTPHVGENGNWWIGDEDLGISSGIRTENIEDFSEGLVFSLTTYNGENAYVVTSFHGSDKNVIIPGYFNGLKVVGIGGFAFLHAWGSNIYLIESVFIPKEIEFIGVYALGDQPNLTEVIIEDNSSLKIIDANAFNYTAISEIILPESLVYIGSSAFGGNHLTSVIIKGDEGRFNDFWESIGFPENLKP